MALSDVICRTAKVKTKNYKLSDGEGMYLLVKINGTKTWHLKYRFSGFEKKLSMGTYPETTLQEARDKRAEAKKLLEKGIDPSLFKKQERQLAALRAQDTFGQIAREWHSNNIEKWSKRHAQDILRRMENDLFPYLEKIAIKDIGAFGLLGVFKRIEQRGANHVAHRLLQVCRKVFQYAIITERAERNVAADLSGALKPAIEKHYSALEIEEFPSFLKDLERNTARLFTITRLAVKFLLLTFVRTRELIEAKWSEFDLDKAIWIIPAERMKMKRPHIVPLSKQAIEILKELKVLTGHAEFVFPCQIDSKRPMSNNTILGAIKRLGYKGKTTGHGFRALAMSAIKEKLDYRHEVIDRQLAHAPANKIIAAYDRAKFLDERKKMMQDWADFMDNLIAA